MNFCGNCGEAAGSGRFCAHCGRVLLDDQPAAAAGPGAATFVNPLAGIPMSDLARDVSAALLLVIALMLPWDLEGDTSDHFLPVLATLVALAALGLPYLSKAGVLPRTWTGRHTHVARIGLCVPYFAAVLVAFLSDLADSRGLGAGIAVGLAGAVLAGQPRQTELHDADREQLERVWRYAAVALSFAAGALTAFGTIVMFTDELLRSTFLLAIVLPMLWLPAVFGWAAVQLARRVPVWPLVSISVGSAALIAVLANQARDDLPLSPVRAPGAGAVLLLAAAAAAAVAAASRESADVVPSHPAPIEVTRALLAVIASGHLVLLVGGVLLLSEFPFERGLQAAGLILSMLGLVGALLSRSALTRSPRQGRAATIGFLSVVAFFELVLLAMSDSPVTPLTDTAVVAMLAMPLGVVIALTVPRSVRAYLDPPSPEETAPKPSR